MKAPILTDAQWQQAWNHCEVMQRPDMYRLLVLLMRKLGLRPMELAGLHSSWFRGDELRIPLGHSKRKSGRSLPVDAEIMEALYEHLQGRVGVVFLNRNGVQFDAGLMSNNIASFFKKAGVQASCYSGRRGAGQKMLDQGADMFTLQAFYGHSSPMTTLAYVGVSVARLRGAMFAQSDI